MGVPAPVARYCSEPDCGERARCGGLCPKHYQRVLRHGDTVTVAKSTPGPRKKKGVPDWVDVHRLAVTDTGGDWWGRAACRGLPVTLFFPDDAVTNIPDPVREVCEGCPVRYEHLRAVLDEETDSNRFGFPAATSRPDRKRIWRALRDYQARD